MSQNRINVLCIQIAKLKAELKQAKGYTDAAILDYNDELAKRETVRDNALDEASKVVNREGVGEIDICKLALNRAVAAIRAMKGKGND